MDEKQATKTNQARKKETEIMDIHAAGNAHNKKQSIH
jgi:hypothetical protein